MSTCECRNYQQQGKVLLSEVSVCPPGGGSTSRVVGLGGLHLEGSLFQGFSIQGSLFGGPSHGGYYLSRDEHVMR